MKFSPIWFDALASTNQFCKDYANALPNGFVAITQNQTGGRGSKGRGWTVLPGQTIALSILCRPSKAQNLPSLPLLCGLTALRALECLGVTELQLKWPNDLLIGNKKIAGILCESVLQKKEQLVVCGIGINLTQTKEQFAEQNLPHAGSLRSEAGLSVEAREILNILLVKFNDLYTLWNKIGFLAFRESYQKHCTTIGREIKVITGGKTEQGFATGLADDGRLICEINGESRRLSNAETSVRGLLDYA